MTSSPPTLTPERRAPTPDPAQRLRFWLAAIWRRLPATLRPAPSLLERFESFALRCGVHPEAIATMRAGHRMRLDLRARFQARAFYSGKFDDERIAAASRFLAEPGATAVDAGANIGLWTVPLGRHAARVGGRVVAIEPVPANLARLRSNLALNGLSDVVDVVPNAVTDRAGRHLLTLREDFQAGATTGNAALEIDDQDDVTFETIAVRLETLDAILERHGNPLVTVIKADIEGHEDLLLAGGVRTFRRCRPVAFFEWNRAYYRRRRVHPTLATQPLLNELGYRCLRLGQDGWLEQRQFWSPRPFDDLILVPRERATEVRRLVEAANAPA